MKTKTNRTLKKLLSIALCLALVVSYAPIISLEANAASSLFVDVNGSGVTLKDSDSDGYYEIGTANELIAFSTCINNSTLTTDNRRINAELTNDIAFPENESWIPIGRGVEVDNSLALYYGGIFDGKGHTISGLNCSNADYEYIGLFGYLIGTVKNVSVVDSAFGSGKNVGGIAGNNTGVIEKCYFSGAINGSYRARGGIAGYNGSKGEIRNCYSNSSIVGGSSGGGIAGYNSGIIENCYSVGNVIENSKLSIGGIAGENGGYGTITNCYYNKSVYSGNLTGTNEGTVDDFSSGKTTTQFKSGEVAYLLQGEQTSAVWGQTLGVDDNPVMGGEKVYYSSELNVYTNYEVSKKNSDGFYEISNAKQLAGFAEYYNAGKIASPANAVLTANINLEGYSWIPIGNASTKYKGVFDGQGHTISNFNMTITGAGNWGLFGYATGEGTVIKNLSIRGNVTTALTSNVDVQYGVVGQADGTAEIRNVHSSVNLTSNDTYQKKYFGGIVGRTGNITVDMCSYRGTLSLGSNTLDCVGGVVGYIYNGKTAQITNCGFCGSIVSTYSSGNVGGILGYYNGENAKALTVSNCLSVGTLPEGRNAIVGAIKNYGSTNAGSNNYYTDGMTHSVSNVTAAAATKIQLKSGEIAIALGDAWGQNLNNGVLNQGYPVVGGATVYCVTNCLGNADYSNTNAVRHASGCVLYNGAYSLCGEFGSNGIVDGVYHISTAEQLVSFAKTVNSGNTEIDAKLINNIDLTGYEWTPIGTAENMYGGLFDGNGKSITVQFSYFGGYEDEKENYSLFGFINNAYIQGLTVKGSIAVRGAYATGLVSQVHGNCIIRRCLTDVDITTLGTMAYASGLVGKVDGCLNIIHCGFTGSMTNPEQTYNSSGLVSDAQNTAEVFIANSFVAADFSDYTQLSSDSGDTFIKGGGIVNMIDCYYLESLNGTPAYATQKTAEQFASGEVAYILQSKTSEQTWGQDSNQPGSTPILDFTGIYKVVKVGGTGNYSVANVGDTNGDGTVDVTDYQAVVNMAVSDGHTQSDTASYDDIVRYDLDGNGYLNVIDASLMHLFINGFTTVDVYAVGDYDLNGVAFEEADIKAIKHAIENPKKLATYKKYASDINGDGKLDENDLTALTSKYGEVTGTECADNVEVYYRWGNSYSTCTATAMCTLCGKKVATETVNSVQNADGSYTATFTNTLLGTKTYKKATT